MKKLIAILGAPFLLVTLVSVTANTQGVITTPRTPSPAASVSQTIGISTVTVQYSRPSVKGREIWGNLVPYGWNKQNFGPGKDAPWRAGANENTVIKFSDPVKIEGHSVPAGEYGLFFTINKDNTGEVILSKDSKAWGSFFYDKDKDQLKSNIKIRDLAQPVELLTYDFINMDKNSAELVLNWEKKQFPVRIEYAVDDIVLANAENELNNTVGFTWQGFNSAANYAVQNKVGLDKALAWSNQAVTMNKSFATLQVNSAILKEMGKTDSAEKIMKEATAIGNEGELNAYGYQLLGEKKYDKAIEILALNAQQHPKSANAWDSLGEAYATKGDNKNAIINFKKSLSMNPPAAVRANSEKYLKQLGAM